MGTECELAAVAPEPQASLALARAECALRNVESLMSVHIEATELSRFNAGGKGEYRVSPELMKVLSAAGRFHEQTDGAFDVTCYPLIRLWKNCKAAGRLPSEAEIAEARKLIGMKYLQIAPDGVTKLADGMMVDLGGIAKGYAIDRAVEAMIEAGATGGLVNVGGDLRCFGSTQQHGPWPVKIRHPFEATRICATLSVTDAAVATSGDYRRFVVIDGQKQSHIMNPQTGNSARELSSVTVITPYAIDADALATSVSVMGTKKGMELIEQTDSAEAILIDENIDDKQNGNMEMTTGAAVYIVK